MDNKPKSISDKAWDFLMKFLMPFGEEGFPMLFQAVYGSILGCFVGYILFDYHGEVRGHLDLAIVFIIIPAILGVVLAQILIHIYKRRG